MFIQNHSIENHSSGFKYPDIGEPPALIRIPPPQLKAYKPFYGSQRTFEKITLEQEKKKYIEKLYNVQYPFLSIQTQISLNHLPIPLPIAFNPPSFIPITLPIPLIQKEESEEDDQEDDDQEEEDQDEDEEENYDPSKSSKSLKLQKFNDEEVIERTGLTIKQICGFTLKKLKEKLGVKSNAYRFAVKKIRRRYTNYKSYNRMKNNGVIYQKYDENIDVNLQKIINDKKNEFTFRKYNDDDIIKKTGCSVEMILDMSIEELRDLLDFRSDEYQLALYIRQKWSLTKSIIISKHTVKL